MTMTTSNDGDNDGPAIQVQKTAEGIILQNPGDRNQKVTKEVAETLVESWNQQLEALGNETNKIISLKLEGRCYFPESAELLIQYLTTSKYLTKNSLQYFYGADIIASLSTDLGLNALEQWSSFLKSMAASSLLYLDLSDNALGSRGIVRCRAILQAARHLKTLLFQNDGLSHESLRDLFTIMCFEEHERQEDDFKENTHAEKPVPRILYLEKLYFFNNMMGVGGAHYTGKILRHCPLLQEFRYEGCRPQTAGTRSLLGGLLDRTLAGGARLTKLLLEVSLGTGKSKKDPIHLLCRVLEECRLADSLQHLKLYDCGLEHSGAKPLLKALLNDDNCCTEKNPWLTLELPQNEIRSTLIPTHLGPFIQQNIATLQVLNLEANELTSVGVEHLMRVFNDAAPTECALTVLNLKENQIGTRGATALIQSRERLGNLQTLDLSENAFPNEAVEKLTETFAGIVLSLEGNMEDDDADDDLEEEEEEDEEEEEEDEEEEDEVDDKDNIDTISANDGDYDVEMALLMEVPTIQNIDEDNEDELVDAVLRARMKNMDIDDISL